MTPILAARPRSDRAFERLYQRHVGDVYRYALAVMRNQADAEDVTQTTFMNAYRAFQHGERPQKPQNWLIAIAHNVCRQRFRQSARRPSEVSFEEDIADRFVDDDDAPSVEDIRRALGQLAFNQRAALVMRELEGRSYAEIAEILKLSTSAVETLIFRARRALREQLETSLTCGEAEFAISRQLDGRISRDEKGALRAHLRQCAQCATFARRQRAQRSALKSLAVLPVPSSLASFFGGSAAVGTGLAVKAAVAVTAGALVGGAGYETVRRAPWKEPTSAPETSRVAVIQDVDSNAALVPAPREHMQPAPRDSAHAQRSATGEANAHGANSTAATKSHGQAATERSRGRGAAPGRGNGQERPSYHGDASVSARRLHTPPPPPRSGVSARPVRPAQPAKPRRQAHPLPPAPKPAPPQPQKAPIPGPYDAGPPPAQEPGKPGGK